MKLKSHTEIIPYKNNPKIHPDEQLLALAKIVNEVGWRIPCLINKKKVMIAGHGRLEMYNKYKDEYKIKPIWTMCDGITVYGEPDKREMTEEQEIIYRIADNKLAESDWDFALLKDEIELLDTGNIDLELTGFDMPEIEEMMTKYGDEYQGKTDDDAIPENVKPICKTGDLWKLGNHRLLCGDATKKEDAERLMDGKKADMVFTDPPYGVDYDGGASNKNKRDKIIGDNTTDLFEPCCKQAFDYSIKNAPLYLWHAGTKGNTAAAAAIKAGYEIRCELIWHKLKAHYGAFTAQYMQKHEPLYYCFKKGNSVNWMGATNEVTVWEIEQSSVNEYHPTQKPVALAERAIKNHNCKSVLDLFLGSGSTLIACEKTNRKCYGMEIDPHYCDVIIKRWEDYTGNKAELING
jgi:DNA modification methylase